MTSKLDQFRRLLASIPLDQKVDIKALLDQWEKEDSRMDSEEALIRLLHELSKE